MRRRVSWILKDGSEILIACASERLPPTNAAIFAMREPMPSIR